MLFLYSYTQKSLDTIYADGELRGGIEVDEMDCFATRLCGCCFVATALRALPQGAAST